MIKMFKYISFKLFITVICLLCLLYQTYLLIEQYLEYNTVINIKFTPNVINSLPAITICYRLYSYEKLVKRYPEYKADYENYINFTKEFKTRNNKDNISSKNYNYTEKYNAVIKNNNLIQFALYKLVIQNKDIQDIFDNLTLPFEKVVDKNNIDNIMVYLMGDNKGKSSLADNYYVFPLKPIESIDIIKMLKCFTFFDETQITFSKNQVNLEEIKIRVNFPQSWFPYDRNIGILIAIHSPNVIPNRNSFYQIAQETIFTFTYSKMENIRLENYDNCIDRGDIENYNLTRHHCLDKCFLKIIRPDCFGSITYHRPHPLRKEQLSSKNMSNLTNCHKLSFYKIYSKCYSICKEDCY